MTELEQLKQIAEIDYSEIIKLTLIQNFKLRIILYDNSYIDVNISKKLSNKYGFHWETRNEFNNIYRYDNYPDNDWKEIETFPFHFHNGYQENVVSAPFSTEIISAFREFMDFVKKLLKIT